MKLPKSLTVAEIISDLASTSNEDDVVFSIPVTSAGEASTKQTSVLALLASIDNLQSQIKNNKNNNNNNHNHENESSLNSDASLTASSESTASTDEFAATIEHFINETKAYLKQFQSQIALSSSSPSSPSSSSSSFPSATLSSSTTSDSTDSVKDISSLYEDAFQICQLFLALNKLLESSPAKLLSMSEKMNSLKKELEVSITRLNQVMSA